ncbi:MAG: hypothetical protein K2X27_04290 [Candidatus Obscuribacterales bacterium]|nr:hypothetical protein [Candidatus Obscuribacterales bacterium]
MSGKEKLEEEKAPESRVASENRVDWNPLDYLSSPPPKQENSSIPSQFGTMALFDGDKDAGMPGVTATDAKAAGKQDAPAADTEAAARPDAPATDARAAGKQDAPAADTKAAGTPDAPAAIPKNAGQDLPKVPTPADSKPLAKSETTEQETPKHRTQLEKKIIDLSQIAFRDMGTASGTIASAEVRSLLLKHATDCAKRLGMPPGLITNASLDVKFGANIAGTLGSFDGTKLQIELWVCFQGNPIETLEHELKHMARAIERTALKQADPKAFEALTLKSMLAAVDGRPYVPPEQRPLLKEALREYLAAHPDPHSDDRSNLSQGGSGRRAILKYLTALSSAGIHGTELDRAMLRFDFAIKDYRNMQKSMVLPDDTVAKNPALKKCIEEKTAKFAESKEKWNGTLEDHPTMRKAMVGASASYEGMRSQQHYAAGSVEEFTANRFGKIAALKDALRDAAKAVGGDKEAAGTFSLKSIVQGIKRLFGYGEASAPEAPPKEYIEELKEQVKQEGRLQKAVVELERARLSTDPQERDTRLKTASQAVKDYFSSLSEKAKSSDTTEGRRARLAAEYFIDNGLIDKATVESIIGKQGEQSKPSIEEMLKLKTDSRHLMRSVLADAKPASAPEDTKSTNELSDHEFTRLSNQIEKLAAEGKAAEIVDLLKTLKDPTLIRIALIDQLPPLDPKGSHLKELALSNSEAGMIALDFALKENIEGLDTILQGKLKDGKLTEALLAGGFHPDNLKQLKLPAEEILTLLQKASPGNEFNIAKAILANRTTGAASEFGRIYEVAAKQIAKLPNGEAALFDSAMGGNQFALKEWEALHKDSPVFRGEHRTAHPVPEKSVLEFHKKALALAEQYGLTPEELRRAEKVSKEIALFSKDAAKVTELKRSLASIDLPYRSAAIEFAAGKYLPSPEIARKALAGSPDLLAKYEAMLRDYPAVEKLQTSKEKLQAELLPEINKLAKAAGLPPLTELSLQKGILSSYLGAYSGNGRMYLDPTFLEKSNLSSPGFVNTVVHEIGHLEQDFQILKKILSEQGFKKGDAISSETFEKFAKEYKRFCKKELQLDFLESTIEAWDGKPISKPDILRAERLALSLGTLREDDIRVEKMQENAKRLSAYEHFDRVTEKITEIEQKWKRDGIEDTLKALKKWCGNDVDSKELLKKLENLHRALLKGAPEEELSTARQELAIEAKRASEALYALADRQYRDRFHEQDTFAAGDEAERVIQKSIDKSATTGDVFPREVLERARKSLKGIQLEHNELIAEGLKLSLEEAREKLAPEEFERVKKLLESYEKGDPAAIEQVNKSLADPTDIAKTGPKQDAKPGSAQPKENLGTDPKAAGTDPKAAGSDPKTTEPAPKTEASDGKYKPQHSPEFRTEVPGKPLAAFELTQGPDGKPKLSLVLQGQTMERAIIEEFERLDKSIAEAEKLGFKELADELREIKSGYEQQKTPEAKAAYAKRYAAEMQKAIAPESLKQKSEVARKPGTVGKVNGAMGLLVGLLALKQGLVH